MKLTKLEIKHTVSIHPLDSGAICTFQKMSSLQGTALYANGRWAENYIIPQGSAICKKKKNPKNTYTMLHKTIKLYK